MKMQRRTAMRRSPWPQFGFGTVVLAAALLGLLQEQARAQTVTKTETTTTDVVFKNVTRCDANQEAVDIYAREKHYTQTQTSASGGVKIADSFNDQGTGTGQVSGAKYGYSFSSDNKFRSSTSTFYIRIQFREHLIRQDATVQGDDWYSLETLLINVTNGNTTFKPETIQADCR